MDSVSTRSENFVSLADLGGAGADAVSLRGFQYLAALGHRCGVVCLGVFQLDGVTALSNLHSNYTGDSR